MENVRNLKIKTLSNNVYKISVDAKINIKDLKEEILKIT